MMCVKPQVGNSCMVNYNRYSHHARRALSHAGTLVRQFRHPRVDTGHLLVGVMLTEGSIGYTVLTDLALDAGRAEPELAMLTLPIGDILEHPPNDAALDIALDLASDESAWLGHHYIGTEHLLLGITRTNVGNAADLLHMLGVQPDTVRRKVRSVLQEGMTEFSLAFARSQARLSELSRRVLNAAEQMSVEYDHQTIGLGHLLFVMVHERRSITSSILVDSGIRHQELEKGLKNRSAVLLTNVEAILNQALEYAQQLGSHYTGTEHLLLALTADDKGASIIKWYGANPDDVRDAVAKQLAKKR